MRKRTLKCLFDSIMWYLIYLLPLIIWLIVLARNDFNSSYNLAYVFDTMGLGILNDNIILTSLMQIFGAEGVFPLFSSPALLIYGTYFVSCLILHLAVDFLAFIPRLAHKWLGWLTQDKE